MAGITTISSTPQGKISHIMDNAGVSYSFICDSVIKRGAAVKLLSTGKVAPIAAATDVVLGIVTVGNKTANSTTEKVTVQMKKAMIVYCKASAIIALGAVVDVTGYDATGHQTIVTTTAGGGNQFGIALTAGAANGQILIALL